MDSSDLFPYRNFLHLQVIDSFEFNVTPPYKDRIFLHQKYVVERMTPRDISRKYFFSHQSVYKYLRLHKIPIRAEDLAPWQQTKFGETRKGNIIRPNKQELKTIGKIQRLREEGHSYEKIASILNAMKVPTHSKNAPWYARTVWVICKRATSVQSTAQKTSN